MVNAKFFESLSGNALKKADKPFQLFKGFAFLFVLANIVEPFC